VSQKPRLVSRGGVALPGSEPAVLDRQQDEIENLLSQLEKTQTALVKQLRDTAAAAQAPSPPPLQPPAQPRVPPPVKTSDKLQIPALSKSVVHEINRQLREMQKFAESQHQLFSGQPSVDALTNDHLTVVIDKVVDRYLPGLRRLLREKIADAVEVERQRLAAERNQ